MAEFISQDIGGSDQALVKTNREPAEVNYLYQSRTCSGPAGPQEELQGEVTLPLTVSLRHVQSENFIVRYRQTE